MKKLKKFLSYIIVDQLAMTPGILLKVNLVWPPLVLLQSPFVILQLNLYTTILSTQKLGEEPSDKHRQSCSEATKPLLDALEELIVFASSAKFTSSPAKISQEGQHTQQPLIQVSH